MGASLPPKPEPKQEQKQKEPSPAAPPQSKEEDMEVESEESDVELDMEGVVKNPDPEEAHEMVRVWNLMFFEQILRLSLLRATLRRRK